MKSFEERLNKLERLAEKLREGQIPLEEAVYIFEEGMKLEAVDDTLGRLEGTDAFLIAACLFIHLSLDDLLVHG